MELLEYIKKNYKTPNVAVLRTLGASEELIEYLCKTPWNTNIKVVEGLIDTKKDEEKFPKIFSYYSKSSGATGPDGIADDSDFQSFEELKEFIDKYKIPEGNGYTKIEIKYLDIKKTSESGTIHYASNNGVTYGSSSDGLYWVFSANSDMEYRLDFTKNTIGYYSYDD